MGTTLFDRLHPLSTQDLDLIHEKTLEILAHTGMWFESDRAREVLKHHGLRVDGEIVYFTRQVIEDALKSIPAKFLLRARNPRHNLEIGGDSFAFGPSGGAPYILDYDGSLRFAKKGDYFNSLKLIQMLDGLDFNLELAAASDIPRDQPMWKVLYAIKYTDKPVNDVDLGGGGLLAILFGLDRKQMKEDARNGMVYGLNFINPVSPLGLSELESDRLMELCESGVALAISPMPIAGMTAPCTIPGLLISQNCEILGTLVLSQLINPGCPVLYGCIGTVANMKNASAPIGTPETRIIEIASAQIARYYGLPTRGNVGLTDANSVDFQAGAESAFQYMNAVRGGLNLLPGLGAMGSWNIGSLEKLVLDAEIAAYVRRFFRPVEFSEEMMGADLIKKVGPRGQFVTEEHTFRHFRDEFSQPFVFSRVSYDLWEKEGKKEAYCRAHEKVKEMIDHYQPPELEKSLEKDLNKYLQQYYNL
ncbi:trimethylamine methyltransferase family protein [Candidatus Formimonas warabiya]|uniref:Trimethylamine methyltransferase n=1 Tax=Formimonas warabiya TaxID=1761012 RepID=A0A3G1KZJ0_FORW1|nr:trimethylamine methyltransferase family protein [Candidatus Formimonas warabiya]ATW27830.1 hypothetical protein DCMF_26495 [Candidatus Formimonas warabiya]